MVRNSMGLGTIGAESEVIKENARDSEIASNHESNKEKCTSQPSALILDSVLRGGVMSCGMGH